MGDAFKIDATIEIRNADGSPRVLEPANNGGGTPHISRRRQRKPSLASPDSLRTASEAAAKLRCSVRTVNKHVASGALRYVIVGHGTKRQRRMFTDADLDTFIANQTRKDLPCQSSRTHAPHSGDTTSKSEVIAFSAQPRPRPSGMRKR